MEAPIRTFRTRGRMSTARRSAMAELATGYRVAPTDGPIDLDATFRRVAPRILDIGFGDGEALLASALARPQHDVLGVEVHTPGVATLLARVADTGATNVRVERADALELIGRLPPASLREVRVFFPDPWPKQRHHARRLIRSDVVVRLATLLEPGGVLHLATDWPHYAAQMRRVLAEAPHLGAVHEDRDGRPQTKYERLGLAAGRSIVDLRAAATGS